MAAALLSFTSLFIFLGAVAGVAALFAVLWAARRCRDGPKDGGCGPSATDKHKGLLNKENKEKAAVQQRGPGPGDSDGELCAICKARLEDEGWGGTRRLRPCGHAYHADCIGLWLQRKWICPVCRAGVAVSPTEIMDVMV